MKVHFLYYSDPAYYNQLTPNSIWPSRMYLSIKNISSTSACSAICTLTSLNCQLYVYVSSNLTCYLGNFATVSTIKVPGGGSEVVNTRVSEISKYSVLDKCYLSKLHRKISSGQD